MGVLSGNSWRTRHGSLFSVSNKHIFLAEAVGRLESEKAAIHAEYEQVRIIRTNILGVGIPF